MLPVTPRIKNVKSGSATLFRYRMLNFFKDKTGSLKMKTQINTTLPVPLLSQLNPVITDTTVILSVSPNRSCPTVLILYIFGPVYELVLLDALYQVVALSPQVGNGLEDGDTPLLIQGLKYQVNNSLIWIRNRLHVDPDSGRYKIKLAKTENCL